MSFIFLRLVLLEGIRVFDTLAFGIAFTQGIHGQLDIVGFGIHMSALHFLLVVCSSWIILDGVGIRDTFSILLG
jgi:hypothetical protein